MPRKGLKPRVHTEKEIRLAAEGKRLYVLRHAGILTPEAMAKDLGVTLQRVYQIFQEIRRTREGEPICRRLTAAQTEGQRNRLERACERTHHLLCEVLTRVEAGEDTKVTLNQAMDAYLRSERALTYFMKAIGIYKEDGPLVAIQQNNTSVTYNTLNEALDEVNTLYGRQMAERIQGRIQQHIQEAIDVQAKELDGPTEGTTGAQRTTDPTATGHEATHRATPARAAVDRRHKDA